MIEERPRQGLGFRPTEYIDVDASVESVTATLRDGFDASGETLDVRWAGEHVLLSLSARRRQAWSPWLSVAVRERSDSEGARSTVVAQFCPHPQLWTAVVLAGIGLASICVLAAGFGWAQLVLQRPAWAFWVALAALLAALALWLGSHLARHLAREQMQELWDRLTAALARNGSMESARRC